jgi:hypothetical protein
MGVKIKCSKGAGVNDSRDFEVESESVKLNALRSILIREQFIVSDSATANLGYRFVMPRAEKMVYEDVILSDQVEKYMPIGDLFINNKREIVLTNVFASKRPDLMGFATNWWSHRHTRVQCRLNKADPEAITINEGKFEPVMMMDVKSTSEKTAIPYDNVCICCKDSRVEFGIRSWGGVGFSFYVGAGAGDPIVSDLYLFWGGDDKDLYGDATIRRWQNDAKTISIIATADATNIDPTTKLHYQKITFKTRNVTSIPRDGKTKSSNTPPPVIGQIQAARAAASTEQKVVVASGGSITPGTATKGGSSEQGFGSAAQIVADSWDNPLGEVIVYFFVFNTLEDAKKIIDRYNLPQW